MKSRQIQIVVLAALLLVFVYIVYSSIRPNAPAAANSVADEPFVPLAVQNPALRLDLLDHLKTLEYQGEIVRRT